MPSPTIRPWLCPKCKETPTSAYHQEWCDGVPVEYVACPTSEVLKHFQTDRPGPYLTISIADPRFLVIPAPEAEA